MADTLQTLNEFSIAATVLGLSEKEKETALALTQKLGIPLHDAGIVPFIGIIKQASQVERLEALISAQSSDFKKDAEALVSKLRASLGTDVEKGVSKALASMPASLTAQVSSALEKSLGDLVTNVDMLVKKESSQRQTFRVAQIAVGVAFVVAMTFAGAYSLGRDQVNADAARWSAMVDLPQGQKWLTLATYNDLDRVLAQSCGPSDGRVVSGSKVCSLELFTSKPVSSSKGVDYVRLSLAEFANKLGWIGYGFAGFIGFGFSWAWSRMKRA